MRRLLILPLPLILATMVVGVAVAQTLPLDTLDTQSLNARYAECTVPASQGGPMRYLDGHQGWDGGTPSPGVRPSRFATPALEAICEPIWQEYHLRAQALKNSSGASTPGLSGALNDARSQGVVK